ncbi:hypothetical protein [Nocardia anaemiae]|uniref:hypothetical protein n=1 Tax=Nocardia anaemiae TaxID=263910 RepID=UPI000B0C443E|nr:hypothetical protein [Nocardia anaemiae]
MLIAPVIPPQTPLHELIQAIRTTARPVAAPVDPDIVYSMCTIGTAGRIHDRAVLDALHWPTDTRLGIRCAYDAILLAHRTDYGTTHVTQGYFRVPFRQRRQANLDIGDKVLLVAHPQHQQLTIYPPPALHPYFGHPHALES